MLPVKKEVWFWRLVGFFSLAICTLNFMVLMQGKNIFISCISLLITQQFLLSNAEINMFNFFQLILS